MGLHTYIASIIYPSNRGTLSLQETFDDFFQQHNLSTNDEFTKRKLGSLCRQWYGENVAHSKIFEFLNLSTEIPAISSTQCIDTECDAGMLLEGAGTALPQTTTQTVCQQVPTDTLEKAKRRGGKQGCNFKCKFLGCKNTNKTHSGFRRIPSIPPNLKKGASIEKRKTYTVKVEHRKRVIKTFIGKYSCSFVGTFLNLDGVVIVVVESVIAVNTF